MKAKLLILSLFLGLQNCIFAQNSRTPINNPILSGSGTVTGSLSASGSGQINATTALSSGTALASGTSGFVINTGTSSGTVTVSGTGPNTIVFLNGMQLGHVNIPSTHIFFVDVGGNDGTGAVGNPSLPYATVQAAFTAGISGTGNYLIDMGVGSWSVTLPLVSGSGVDWPPTIQVRGAGKYLTALVIYGAGGDYSDSPPTTHASNIWIVDAGGWSFQLCINPSNGPVSCGSITDNSSTGDTSATGANLTFENCYFAGTENGNGITWTGNLANVGAGNVTCFNCTCGYMDNNPSSIPDGIFLGGDPATYNTGNAIIVNSRLGIFLWDNNPPPNGTLSVLDSTVAFYSNSYPNTISFTNTRYYVSGSPAIGTFNDMSITGNPINSNGGQMQPSGPDGSGNPSSNTYLPTLTTPISQ